MYIAGQLAIPTTTFLSKITERQVASLIDTLKCLVIPIADYRPMAEAIVTAGGVSLEDVDPATMQSRKVRGLYFAGEVLDLDGNTGGFNLQIAFSTGYLAGQLKK
jgi:predicted flavoprotein YhiN